MSGERLRITFLLTCLALVCSFGVPGYAASPLATVAWEFASGAVGGLGGAALAVLWIADVNPTLEGRLIRTAMVIGSVSVLAGSGATVGVLAAGKLLDTQGNVSACFLGGFIGSFASMWVEPLLYTLRIPEEITEFFGMLMLPIVAAIGATIGFNGPIRQVLAVGS